ncbi:MULTISPECIES: hypothetical protein [Cysteiniphilum]|uniref:Uncharacterized protein n=1 Tax=Cysteiniphilum litorale TaxID=2056700 RepID=A0A8J2Z6S2_9GAMM|nr:MULTISPECIES: hypothetical protein [Cysteiniphilum]GGG07118.1 hypothetical protein GCM10010995_25780 [Cysteiniphilum litorale]
MFKSQFMSTMVDQLRLKTEEFLTTYPIFEAETLMIVDRVPMQGVQSFEFSKNKAALNGLWLDVGNNSAFKCYWLPWKSQKTTSILLEDRANYFFTSQLGGCRVVITPKNNRKSAHIIHIAGDGETIRRGVRRRDAHKVWKDQEQQKHQCKVEGFEHRRKVTSTDSNRDYSYSGEGGNIIGVRAANGQWHFWLQKINFSTGTVEFVNEIDFCGQKSSIDLTEASEEFFYVQSQKILKSNIIPQEI